MRNPPGTTPQKNENSLSVVLPVYNEAANIEKLIKKSLSCLQKVTDDFEIIAVNDGSIDQSGQIIAGLAQEHPCIHFINNRENQGYGRALRQGIDSARKSWILLIDSDGQFDIAELGDFWRRKHGIDCLLGWRRKRNDPLLRVWLGAAGNALANILLRPDFSVKDINCGFKLFKARAVKRLRLISTGGAINFDILFRLKNAGLTCGQLPVKHFPRPAGRATGGKAKTILKICAESLKIIFTHATEDN